LAAFVALSCFASGLAESAVASAQDYGSSSPSEVQTEPAEVIPGGARLRGELNPGGLPTTYYFEYIADNAVECLGVENCWPQTAHMGPITGDSQQQVPPVEVTGLRMGETYRYRLAASNVDGTVQSKIVTFTVGFSPVITSLEPNHGPTFGGTVVTIHGEPLENARSVHFGTVEGKILHEECDGECEIVPYRTLVVESPPHAAGTVDVTVETAQGASVTGPGDKFTYGPSEGPSIESESVTHLTPTDATLEAQIDTEGLSTFYQFQLSSICGGKGVCLYVIDYPLPSGLLLGSFVDQSVSLDLNSAGVTLQPGGTYYYSVSATSTAGTTEDPTQELTTPEEALQPLNTTTTPPSSAGLTAGLGGGGQVAGSGVSSSSPSPGVGVLGTQTGKTTKLKSLTNAQKLAKALKACEKKPKGKRAECEKQAHRKYPTTASRTKKG
jgi:IPT/TIG domain